MSNMNMPWYVKIFSGIFAWISGCCFLSFLALFSLLPDKGISGLTIGVLSIGFATYLVRKNPGPFLSQGSLALSVTGHYFILISMAATDLSNTIIPITCIVLWTILYIPTPSSVHRFFSTILVWFTVTIFYIYLHGIQSLYFIIPVQWFIALFLSTTDRKIFKNDLNEIGKPAAIASIISGFSALIAIHMPYIHIEHVPFSIFFGIVSLILVSHYAKSLTVLVKPPHIYGTLVIIAMSFFAPPGLLAAISIGILGFGASNILLSGAATIFLPVFLFILYYDMAVSLAWKSWVLAGSGLLFLLVRKIATTTPQAIESATKEILSQENSKEPTSNDKKDDHNKDGEASCNEDCSKTTTWKYYKHILYGTCVLIILTINTLIIEKELILKNGESILLKLVPVDPRSLMQGDYMILRYEIADILKEKKEPSTQISASLPKTNQTTSMQIPTNSSQTNQTTPLQIPDEGNIIVEVDNHMRATFKELDDGRKLLKNERRITFKFRAGNFKLGAESFFFQEGHAQIYSNAKYGELKVKENGTSVLVGLRNDKLKKLLPPEKKQNSSWM